MYMHKSYNYKLMYLSMLYVSYMYISDKINFCTHHYIGILVSLSSLVYVVSEGRALSIEILLTGGDRNITQMIDFNINISPRTAQGSIDCTCTCRIVCTCTCMKHVNL